MAICKGESGIAEDMEGKRTEGREWATREGGANVDDVCELNVAKRNMPRCLSACDWMILLNNGRHDCKHTIW